MADLIIPFDAKPDYDDWGPDSFWDLGTWIGWHRGLVKKYGRTLDKPGGYPIADKIWLDAWTKQGTGASPTLAIVQPARFKTETDYIRKFPLLYQYTNLKKLDGMVNPLDVSYNGLQGGLGAVNSVVSGTEAAISGVGTGLKVLKYAIPIVLTLAIGTGMYIAYNKFVKA